jgi:hypothetical protein
MIFLETQNKDKPSKLKKGHVQNSIEREAIRDGSVNWIEYAFESVKEDNYTDLILDVVINHWVHRDGQQKEKECTSFWLPKSPEGNRETKAQISPRKPRDSGNKRQ